MAIGTQPGCAFEPKDPFWSFSKCFAPTEKLDDPELDVKFAALRQAYGEATGTDDLDEARQALKVPGLALGSEPWLRARAAVRRFRETQDLRRDLLRQLQQLAYEPSNASAADRAKMRQTIKGWSDFLQSQETNYSELLQRLAWAGE